MKKLFLALALCAFPSFADAACTGIFAAGSLCGSSAGGPPIEIVAAQVPSAISLTNGNIFVGNAANKAASVAMSQDCTIVSSGAITCTKTNNVAFSALATTAPGTGVATALGINVGSAGAFVTFNGALGTPSSATLTNATGLPISTGVSGLGAGVAAALGNPLSANAGVTSTIASGATALGTGAISSATCATVVTATATNTLTTDAIIASFNGDPTGVTGYIPSTNGMLTIIVYPTANNVNFKVCNNTTASITPGAITINWRVVR